MHLFPLEIDPNKNWLPMDGCVLYLRNIVGPIDMQVGYFQSLFHSIEWKNDEAILFGKKIITKRKVAWYGDEPFSYTYSNVTKQGLIWNSDLLEIKALVEDKCGESFNSCLLNLYHNGSEGMSWHSDGEKDLKANGTIASLSLGAERKFAFKHKQTKEKVELWLESGSLLLMKDQTQSHWLHRLPPSKKIHEPRINLTFRNIVK